MDTMNETAELQARDRVYVTQLGTDGPCGNATVTAIGGLDGVGNPIATVMLDEYVTTHGRHSKDQRDVDGRSLCEWVVSVDQLRKIQD